ncbi:MAG: homoserine kinase [Candidatus Neomarinimicrobiota bacterium]|jgi:homoserine kinase|nr:homoserine kinase [Candidatus Neomarinimicrobiota bacterium]MDX9779701.1 homoserine kinase [bacterium]
MNIEYRAFAPASIGNLSVGFDCLGLCLEAPGDTVRVRKIAETGVLRIRSIQGDEGKLSHKISENVCGRVAKELLKAAGSRIGVEINIQKGLPLKSGMGSSAASSAATALAVNALLGDPFSKEALLPFVLEGEKLAGGAAHADNAAPCLLGGIRLIPAVDSLISLALPYPPQLCVALVHPQIDIATRQAREILPKMIPLSTAVLQSSALAGFVHGLARHDWGLIARSMRDYLAEPVRRELIPYFSDIKESALKSGALNFGISGSGPAVFALCRGIRSARKVAAAMARLLSSRNIAAESFVSRINTQGTVIL